MAKFRGTALVFVAFMLLLFSALIDVSFADAFTSVSNATISEVRITNVRENTFTVSWITDQEVTGTVQYGTDPANLNQTANDDRGPATSDDTHHVIIPQLSASTTYHFNVVSGGTTDNNNGTPYTVTTGPNLPLPAPDTVFGEVFKTDGSTFAEGTIVYFTVRDNNGAGSTGSSAPLSMLVENNGFWSIGLGNARTSDLNSSFTYSANGGDELVIEAQGANDGIANQTVDTANDAPAPNMTLRIVPRPNVELSPNDAKSGDPSTTVNYSVQVTNTGNVTDTFTLSTAGSAWTTTPSPASVTLNPGISTTIGVSVMIPAGTLANASDTATIRATSMLSPTVVSDTTSLTTTANQVRDVDVSPNMTQTGVVSTTVMYSVQITNTGNGNDTFNLMAGNHTWPTTLPPSTGPLAAGASITVIAKVEIPANALGGMTDTATITATSTLNNAVNDTTTLTTQAIAVVQNVEISPDMALSGDPGSTVNYTLQVTNTGNVTDTFAVTAAGGTSTPNVSPASVTLNPGISTTITASVTIPAGTLAGTSDMATVTATSTLSATVTDSTNLTTTANAVPAVEISPDMALSGDPGSTVNYTLQVTNTGNVADTFAVTAAGGTWTPNVSPASVTLNVGASATITASVMIPTGTAAGDTDMATITATSALSPTVSDSTNLTTTANAVPAVEISPDMALSDDPGSTVNYTLQVTNTGNVADTFAVTAAGGTWRPNVSPASVTLNVGASATITASVTIPAGTLAGTNDMATITATSALSATVSDSTNLTTTANAVPAVEISPDMALSGDPGSTVNYTLQVTNTGNVADTFAVTAAGGTWTPNVSPASVMLNVGASATITASVMIPTDAAAGDTDMATITATSALSPTVSDSANLTTTADQVAGVDVTSPDTTQTGVASTTVMYSVQVRNTGNGSDTFNLTVGNETWTTTLSPASTGSLGAGESMTVMAAVQIPANASTGMSDMATIIATSTFDGAVNDTITLTTEAEAAAPGVDVSDMAQSGLVGTTISYMVPVANTGNVMDRFTVTISAGHTWTTTLNVSSVGPLQPGESEMAIVSVSVPPTATSGMTDTATIIATSMFSPTVSDSANLTTTASVTPMAGVEISADMDSKSGDPGSTVDYSLQVMNKGNVSDTFTVSVGGETWMTTVSSDTVILNAGASATITASVTISADASANESDTATIMATSALSPTVSDSADLTTTANQVAGVEISPDMAMSDTTGSMVNYMVTITNRGNGADTFDLAVSGETWTTNVSPDTVSLNAGASTMVTVTVEIPGDADDGDSDTATVTATSQADSTVSDQAQLTTTVSISQDPDQDQDGIPGNVEDGAPNGGDGNNDGTPDREQANVTSLPNAADQNYVTFESPANTSLISVTAVSASQFPTITIPNGEVNLKQDLFGFIVDGVSGSVVITLTLHSTDTVNSYWKYGPEPGNTTDHWYEFDFDSDTGTGAVINDSNVITLHFVDGGRGDHDLSDDGQIMDPGGPGRRQITTSVSLASFEGQTAMPARQAGLVLLATLMAGAGLFTLRRRQKGSSTTT